MLQDNYCLVSIDHKSQKCFIQELKMENDKSEHLQRNETFPIAYRQRRKSRKHEPIETNTHTYLIINGFLFHMKELEFYSEALRKPLQTLKLENNYICTLERSSFS